MGQDDCGSQRMAYAICSWTSTSRIHIGYCLSTALVCSMCSLGSTHTVGEKTSTVYQLIGATVHLIPPQIAPALLPRGEFQVWLKRPQPGGSLFPIATDVRLQVRTDGRFLIIDPMNDTVDGNQYKYIIQFLNGTRLYETKWATVRLGSELELCAFSFSFLILIPLTICMRCSRKCFSES